MVGTSNERKELSVAILLEDAAAARSLASSFRKLGVLPSYYESLVDYFADLEGGIPDLTIIDVKKMSEGDLIFIDHQLVQNKCLPIAFYYDDQSIPLVNSTFEIFNYGTIRKSLNYDGQLKSVLARYNSLHGQYEENQILRKRVDNLQVKSSNLLGQLHDLKEREGFELFLEELVASVEQRAQKDDFHSACLDVFGKWDEVQSLGMYELSANQQRLVSFSSKNTKTVSLPPLWLGQVCREGIEFFAENMASNVAMDLLGKGGKNIVTLKIHGMRSAPELLLFLRMGEEYIPNFNWNLLEKMLTGIYRLSLLKKMANYQTQIEDVLNPWEMIEFLEKEYALDDVVSRENDKQLVVVDFDVLLSTIKERPKLRFNWTQFHKDFLFFLDRNIDCSYISSHWGVDNLTFVVNRADFEEFFIALKALTTRFSYWRYFADSALVLALDLTPQVDAVPFSPMAYLRYVERENKQLSAVISKVATRASNIFNERPRLDA